MVENEWGRADGPVHSSGSWVGKEKVEVTNSGGGKQHRVIRDAEQTVTCRLYALPSRCPTWHNDAWTNPSWALALSDRGAVTRYGKCGGKQWVKSMCGRPPRNGCRCAPGNEVRVWLPSPDHAR
jgi:hypothetical protein